MASGADQKKLHDLMESMMEEDSERFQILPISPFGLMQISRQRHSQSLDRDMRRPCPYCGGCGTVESAQSTAVRVIAKLSAELKSLPPPSATDGKRAMRVLLHDDVLQALKKSAAEQLAQLESDWAVSIAVVASETAHREKFSMTVTP
jgi:ribonuclease G